MNTNDWETMELEEKKNEMSGAECGKQRGKNPVPFLFFRITVRSSYENVSKGT